ncbi:hypothetical protein T484DRAFT_1777579 [Baffinella frigidus]|nr:hypothetical protein T484DRAFT_1777579 [Cryptophyta sp. CCMP2293]
MSSAAAQDADRLAREAFEELNCDWPLFSSDQISALCAALPPSSERVPRWFAITDKLAKGVAYVCDSGCTRAPDESTGDDSDAAPAPPPLPDSEAIPKMLIATLLLAIPRIAKQDLAGAAATLAGVRDVAGDGPTSAIARQAATDLGVAKLCGDGGSGGAGEEAAAVVVVEEDVFAADEDGDDFEFAALEAPAGEQAFLASLHQAGAEVCAGIPLRAQKAGSASWASKPPVRSASWASVLRRAMAVAAHVSAPRTSPRTTVKHANQSGSVVGAKGCRAMAVAARVSTPRASLLTATLRITPTLRQSHALNGRERRGRRCCAAPWPSPRM